MPEIVEATGGPGSPNSTQHDMEPLIGAWLCSGPAPGRCADQCRSARTQRVSSVPSRLAVREPSSAPQPSASPRASPESKSWLPQGVRSWIRKVAGKTPSEPGTPAAQDGPPPLQVLEEGGGPSESKEEKPSSPSSSAAAASVSRVRRSDPVCLICLETLTSEEFRDGRAMTLDCHCRGDLALRHRECAIKWAQVKGDRVCELCKHEVRNLPEVAPRPPPEDVTTHLVDDSFAAHMVDLAPSHADLVFDCVRVTWVAMIVSILFFDMNLASALWTGLVAGLAYSFMVRLMYRQHFAAMQRLADAHAVPVAPSPPGQARAGARPVQIPVVTVV